MQFFNGKKEEGVALVIVFFIMVIVVAVVLSLATYLYSDIKVIRDMSSSVVSFYAADSGVEKVLYYDRKVTQGSTPQVRGVCAMCHGGNGGGGSCSDFASDPGLSCTCSVPVAGATDPIHGCDPNVCDDCTVSFTTPLNDWGVTYAVKAIVYPHQIPYDMEIDSSGAYGGVGRALDITLNPNQ